MRFNEPALVPTIEALLGAMAIEHLRAHPIHQDRRIHGSGTGPFTIDASGDIPKTYCADQNELLYAIEKPFIMAAQRAAGALALYLHAAVFDFGGNAVIVAGATRSGKSTLAHFALSHNIDLLSDELAPITLGDFSVSPYPRGIRLRKAATPDLLPLGAELSILPWPYDQHLHARKVKAIYVLSGESKPLLCSPLTNPAEALFALYPSVLNGLAHDNAGLIALEKIITATPVYALNRGPLDKMLDAIKR